MSAMEVDEQPPAAVAAEEEPEEQQVWEALAESDPARAITVLQEAVAQPPQGDDGIKRKATAIAMLGNLLRTAGRAADVAALMTTSREFLSSLSKAKGGQIFRSLLDAYLAVEPSAEKQVEVTRECIEWTKAENRTFLRQALEVRLIALFRDAKQYKDSLATAHPLIKELKRLDDKALLVEVQVVECQDYYALGNYPKARAALVSARTTANAIYCPPRMQAALDLESGILHAQEGDFKTGFSYFYESFEGYDSVDDKAKAMLGLKYMLLSKIMLNDAADVPSIISGKLALKYTGREIEAMQAVANASLERSLAAFEEALNKYDTELRGDVIINSHLAELFDKLLTQNLLRIVEPFSCIEIDHVASLIKRPRDVVETKLSQMILDGVLHGILDQGAGCLEIFDESSMDMTYKAALDTIEQTGHIVQSLFQKSRRLF